MRKRFVIYEGVNDEQKKFWTVVDNEDGTVIQEYDNYEDAVFAADDWEYDTSPMNRVADTMEREGFDYCFRDYSMFEEIEDPEFHRLRKAYCDAASALECYVFENTFEPE